jgi:hypothetical protein
MIAATESIVQAHDWSRHYPGPADAEIFDDIALYCD